MIALLITFWWSNCGQIPLDGLVGGFRGEKTVGMFVGRVTIPRLLIWEIIVDVKRFCDGDEDRYEEKAADPTRERNSEFLQSDLDGIEICTIDLLPLCSGNNLSDLHPLYWRLTNSRRADKRWNATFL